MIMEMVTCDYCEERHQMDGGMVPESWVRFDGMHYCTASCFTAYLREARGY
jgi:hypothetical protein